MTAEGKVTVTVGIPAYNEGKNIWYLLQDILAQQESGFFLDKIIVNSDGSDDDTVTQALSIDCDRIEVIDSRERRGQAIRQNEIIERTNTDVLVLLNADIILDGSDFLRNLIHPIVSDQAGFTSANILAIEPKTFIEKLLTVSEDFRNYIFENWNRGENLYTCRGSARAFGRKFYRQLRFPESVGEDTYSYLFGIKHGHVYRYVPSAVVHFKLPSSLMEHLEQSRRFIDSQSRFVKEFGLDFVKHEYALPKYIILRASLITFYRHPMLFSAYIVIMIYSRCRAFFREPVSSTWEIATSTKQPRS